MSLKSKIGLAVVIPKYDFNSTFTESAHPSIESPTKNLLVFLGILISGNFSI